MHELVKDQDQDQERAKPSKIQFLLRTNTKDSNPNHGYVTKHETKSFQMCKF
ncbi:hypothetical protein HanRHA438_Chr01g0032821 [Helianthus annuus]|nr:hypothetical protein HanRHA438_Chr01g0032821 [Helianthus annuus]